MPKFVRFRAICVAFLCIDGPDFAESSRTVLRSRSHENLGGQFCSRNRNFGLAKSEFVSEKVLKSGQLKCTLSGIFNRPEPLCTLPKGKLRVAEKRKNYKVRY